MFPKFLENLANFLCFLYCAYGIPGITFTNGFYNTSSRKRRQLNGADDALSAVQNYGCWCSQPFTGDAYRGKPLDEVDSLCKSYSQCMRCSKINNFVGSVVDPYTLTFIAANDSYTCVSGSECGLNRCE